MKNKINNLEVYNSAMEKTMLDKIFFLDKVDADIYVDFGCATGKMFEYISFFQPDAMFIGYDTSSEMVEQAQKKFKNKINFLFSSDWNDIYGNIMSVKKNGGKTCLILSSVIHEVYEYGTAHDVDIFWKRVFESNFDFIVIRDMIPSKTINRPSDINDVIKIEKLSQAHKLSNFQSYWGSIENFKNLFHYLLKYRYNENWEREVQENYIPLYVEDIKKIIPLNYRVIYKEHYTLPFIQREVRKSFLIELTDNTHLKLIMELRK